MRYLCKKSSSGVKNFIRYSSIFSKRSEKEITHIAFYYFLKEAFAPLEKRNEGRQPTAGGGGSLGEAPLPETALNVCLCLPGERSLHFLTVAGAGMWGLRRWSLGWVRWQHRQVLLRSQAVDRMAFGASGREQSTTKVHLGSHPHPQQRLRKDPELLPRCRPSPVLPSATQSKKQVATPRGLHCAGCWLGVGPQLPHREGLGSPQPPPRPTQVGVYASKLPSVWMEDPIPRQVSLWISLLNV